ncbi:folylpolyglutamate synthase/dihydrofolate synthase family protein [Porphyromonadaceae bacterium W3.11]|nr:folylpolyglutamate synthase/dihydrofolate synthase family protein [Porphyromonadaceae bacterium W3.11]
MMNYQETIEYLYTQLPQFQTQGAIAYKPGLERVEQLLAFCGSPQNDLSAVHVAGTNGKGSTSTMLAAILASAGYKVGLFTSPHLIDFRERIRVNGEMIPESEVVRFVENILPKIPEDLKPSFFELTTAMAFDYFAREKVDIAVIEVGMGGRLDSTNVIKPLVSVITNVSVDHAAYLGSTLSAIAGEKAGIIKSHIPVVLGQSSVSEVSTVVRKNADKLSAPLIFADQKSQISGYFKIESGGYQIISKNFGSFVLPLEGDYQLENMATVLEVLLLLRDKGFNIADSDVRLGVRKTKEYGLRGRLEVIHDKDPKVVIDTGHNPGAWEHLHNELDAWTENGGLLCVIGMAADKDVKQVLSKMPSNAHFIFCKAKGDRSMPAEELAEHARSVGLSRVTVIPDVYEAYQYAMEHYSLLDTSTIFIGGSNFVVGELLSNFK